MRAIAMAVGVLPAPPTVGSPMQMTGAATRTAGFPMRRVATAS